MLEKMGWSQGKGLGVNESGSTDPVHVSYKWDNKGARNLSLLFTFKEFAFTSILIGS